MVCGIDRRGVREQTLWTRRGRFTGRRKQRRDALVRGDKSLRGRHRMPKALNHPAKGCRVCAATLGTATPTSNPARVESIPHILFIKFDFVSSKQLADFILKLRSGDGAFPVRRCRCGRPHLRKANGENPITTLPCKFLHLRRLSLQPTDEPRFSSFDDICHRFRFWNARTADAHGLRPRRWRVSGNPDSQRMPPR